LQCLQKKEAARRRALHSTGGGEFSGTTLSDAEVKVAALLTNEAIEGVCGGVDIGIGKFEDTETLNDLVAAQVDNFRRHHP